MESSDIGEITIEVAKLADAEQIKDVQLATWLKTYPNKVAGITVDDIEARFADVSGERMVRRKRNLKFPEPGTTTLVARKDGEVVGVCMMVKKSDRNQLQMIYVHPEYQRLGIGKKLWDEGRKFIDSTKDTYVEVVDYNKQAINFYTRLGFIATGNSHQDERFRMKSGGIFTEMEMVLKAL